MPKTTKSLAVEVATATCVSKSASVLALLKRDDGATLAELIEATGWLPHITRTALTGLRTRSHGVERSKRNGTIRDKIAASKAKGMWMGGVCALGYRPNGRTLDVLEDQARVVREMFRPYLEIGNVRLLATSLERDQIVMPIRTTTSGREHGGNPFTCGELYRVLRSRIYIGEIAHCDLHYAGLHEAIVDCAAWDAVQERLALNLQGNRDRTSARNPSLLAGKIVDGDGQPLIATPPPELAWIVSSVVSFGSGGKP